MSKIRFLPLGIVAALCLGCAEERSLEPAPVAKLPAMNVTDNPVVALSEVFSPLDSAEGWQSEYAIAIPESAVLAIRPDDILLAYHTPNGCGSDVFVLEPARQEWHQVARQWPSTGCPAVIPRQDWLLSMLGSRPASFLLDAHQTLHLKGDAFGSPTARLVRYRSDYRFVAIGGAIHVAALACDGRALWVSARFFPDNSGAYGDSLLQIDFSGERIRSSWPNGEYVHAIAWDGHTFWALHGTNLLTISRMDSIGNLSPAFILRRRPDALGGLMTWADDHLWITGCPGAIIGINVLASVDSGYSVIDREITLPTRLAFAEGITSDGDCLYVAAYWLYRISLAGQVVDSLPLPVRVAGGIAWDGEAFWALHHGPIETPTQAMLLSRFYPR